MGVMKFAFVVENFW